MTQSLHKISLITNDSNHNGKLESIVATYSENLAVKFCMSKFISCMIYSRNSTLSWNTLVVGVGEKSTTDTSSTPQVSLLSNSSVSDDAWKYDCMIYISYINRWYLTSGCLSSLQEDVQRLYFTFSEPIISGDFVNTNIVLQNAWAYSVVSTDFAQKSALLSNASISILLQKFLLLEIA